MTTSALLAQLLQKIKLAFRLPPIALQSCQRYKTGLNYQEIQKKDILTLDEAAVYIGTDPETLLVEVSLGHLPGRQLAGQWLFYKWALAQRFAGYRQPGDDESDDDGFENFQEEIDKACEAFMLSDPIRYDLLELEMESNFEFKSMWNETKLQPLNQK